MATPRIGVLTTLADKDPEGQLRVAAFRQELQKLGWIEGRNIRFEDRWAAGDAQRLRAYAEELVGMAPAVMLAANNTALRALQEVTRTVPIVFAQVADPVGSGHVASLARLGGNITGFARPAAIAVNGSSCSRRSHRGLPGSPSFTTERTSIENIQEIEAVIASFGVQLSSFIIRNVSDIERAIDGFSIEPHGGLIILPGSFTVVHRDLIISLAIRHALPNVHAYRYYPAAGGFSWFAASVLVTAGIIYGLKLQDDRHQRPHPPVLPPRATPAQEPLTLQQLRAVERGRGRGAHTPSQIPWRGWKDVIVRTYRRIQDNRVLAVAAGVAFYSLVALFPAIAAGVSSYALFANVATISKHLSIASDIIPAGSLDLLSAEITRIAAKSDGKLTFGFLLGLGIALWSSNAGMKAIFDALNIIYDEDDKRGLIWLNMVSLFFTVCAIAAVGMAISLVVVFPLFLAAFGLTSLDHPIVGYLRWPVMFVLMILGLSVLYRYGPSRRLAKWRWISIGSVFAALAWLAVSSLFSWYLSNFANYNATYGALGAVVGLMMWMWLSIIVVLVGAELNSEIEHQTAHDSTVGLAKPLGVRGAVMADTVGAGVP